MLPRGQSTKMASAVWAVISFVLGTVKGLDGKYGCQMISTRTKHAPQKVTLVVNSGKPQQGGCVYATLQHVFTIRRPPAIITGPTASGSVLLYRIGAPHVRLACEANGIPDPKYHWFKNGVKIDFSTSRNMKQVSPGGALLITTPSIFEEGYYQCVAENMYGKSMSDILSLQRALLQVYQKVPPLVKHVTEGEPLTIECKPTKSNPYPTYQWALVASPTDQSVRHLRMNDRVGIDAKGNLHFSHVMPQDAQDGELYKCEVFNPQLDLMTGGSYTQIKVTKNPNVKNKKPSILYGTSTSLIALQGDTLKMKCIFKGRPTPTIHWQKVDGVLPVGRYKYDSHYQGLSISHIQAGDAGKYKCLAENSAGTSDIYEIKVKVEARPQFLKPPESKNISVGESVTFDCNTTAMPRAEITWYRNGQNLNLTQLPGRWALSEENTKLTISNLAKRRSSNTRGDLMNIQCNASNIHGYTFADFYVNVLMPVTIVNPPINYTVDENIHKIILMNCTATADDSTPVTIEWRKDDQRVICDDAITQNVEGHLQINITSVKDRRALEGKYTCVATNGYDTRTASAYLTVPDLIVDTALVAGRWWVYLSIIIIGLILILLVCLCCLCCRRRRSGKYTVHRLEHKGGNDPEKECLDMGYQPYHRPEEKIMKGSRGSVCSYVPPRDSGSSDGSPDDFGDIDLGDFQEDGSFHGEYAEREMPPPYTPRA